MKDKVLKKSPVVIALYVISALLLAYTVYTVISTIVAIANYAAPMQTAMAASEILTYVLQALVTPLASTVTVFAAGTILNETRKLNPANYVSVKELEAAKAQKEPEKKVEVAKEVKKEDSKPVAKKPAAKKATTATKKPAAKKATTTAKKPAAKKSAAKKPAAKKTTTTKKPAAKKPAAK